MITINITDSLCLTFDGQQPEGSHDIALLTARSKDHDLTEDQVLALRDACDAAVLVFRARKRSQ